MQDFLTFVPSELMILVVALYMLGVGIKSSQLINDKYIPIILLAVGIAFSLSIAGFTATAALQGVVCWGVSIGLNQLYKQNKK